MTPGAHSMVTGDGEGISESVEAKIVAPGPTQPRPGQASGQLMRAQGVASC
jgi:hypothetical protein